MIDKGRQDGVEIGFTFDLYLGSKYKAHVRVLEIQETTCTSEILGETSEVAKGDSASTVL